jgi:hypothetical protein
VLAVSEGTCLTSIQPARSRRASTPARAAQAEPRGQATGHHSCARASRVSWWSPRINQDTSLGVCLEIVNEAVHSRSDVGCVRARLIGGAAPRCPSHRPPSGAPWRRERCDATQHRMGSERRARRNEDLRVVRRRPRHALPSSPPRSGRAAAVMCGDLAPPRRRARLLPRAGTPTCSRSLPRRRARSAPAP